MTKLKLGLIAIALATLTSYVSYTEVSQAQHFAQAETHCLAQNIYHEARGETVLGQIAVAQVTLNRLSSGKFQKTICEVVFANKQFSWTISKLKTVRDIKAWQGALNLAHRMLTDKTIRLPDFDATYFHTKQVSPRWKAKKRIVAVIGNHIFYT